MKYIAVYDLEGLHKFYSLKCRTIPVCFGVFSKQPEKQSAANRRTAHITEPRSLIFCSNHTELKTGFKLLTHFGPNQPTPLLSAFPLSLYFMFTPRKNSICLLGLMSREELLFVIYKQYCSLRQGIAILSRLVFVVTALQHVL